MDGRKAPEVGQPIQEYSEWEKDRTRHKRGYTRNEFRHRERKDQNVYERMVELIMGNPMVNVTVAVSYDNCMKP